MITIRTLSTTITKEHYHKKEGATLVVTKIKIQKEKVRRSPYSKESKSAENLLKEKRIRIQRL